MVLIDIYTKYILKYWRLENMTLELFEFSLLKFLFSYGTSFFKYFFENLTLVPLFILKCQPILGLFKADKLNR